MFLQSTELNSTAISACNSLIDLDEVEVFLNLNRKSFMKTVGKHMSKLAKVPNSSLLLRNKDQNNICGYFSTTRKCKICIQCNHTKFKILASNSKMKFCKF